MDSIGLGVCVGFVVNVHDPLNYDIDLLLPKNASLSDTLLGYADYRNYTFGRSMSDTNITERKAYRCRLRGVVRRPDLRSRGYRVFRPPSFMSSSGDTHDRSTGHPTRSIDRKAWMAVTRQVDRSNGWVICSIVGVDRYRRVLVDIVDPLTKIPLKAMLLQEPYNIAFTAYRPGPTISSNLGSSPIADVKAKNPSNETD